MKDINGMILKVGDSINTSQGVLTIGGMVAPDNDAHQGELVRCKNTKGGKVEVRLKLVNAEYISPTKPTGFKLGDMLARHLTK